MEKKFKSRVEIADLLGIPRTTFVSYYTGQHHVVNPDIRKKLFDLTGIESYKSDKHDTQEGNLLKEWINSVVETLPRKGDINKDSQQEDSIHTGTDNNLGNGSRPFLNMASDLRNWFNNQHQWTTQKEFADHIGVSHSGMKKIFQGIREPKGIVKQKLYELTRLECFRDIDQDIIHGGDIKSCDDIKVQDNEIKPGEDIRPGEYEKLVDDIKGHDDISSDRKEIRIGEDVKLEQLDNNGSIEKSEEYIRKLKEYTEKLEKEIKILKGKKITRANGTAGTDDVDKLVNIFYLLAKALEPFKHDVSEQRSEQRKKIRNKIPPRDLGYVISFLKAMYNEDDFTDFMFFSEYRLTGDGENE